MRRSSTYFGNLSLILDEWVKVALFKFSILLVYDVLKRLYLELISTCDPSQLVNPSSHTCLWRICIYKNLLTRNTCLALPILTQLSDKVLGHHIWTWPIKLWVFLHRNVILISLTISVAISLRLAPDCSAELLTKKQPNLITRRLPMERFSKRNLFLWNLRY